VLALRRRQRKNLLATLFLAQGVPMLLAGDETGNSQGGNNNAYCQDNEIGWVDWSKPDPDLVDFIRRLADLRLKRSSVARAEFLTGRRDERGRPDVTWFASTGERMDAEEWAKPHVKCLTVRLSPSRRGEPMLVVMLNGAEIDVTFTAPSGSPAWVRVLDTADGDTEETLAPGETSLVPSRSLRVYESRQT
jgi:isoamylase